MNDVDASEKNVIRLNKTTEISFYGSIEGKADSNGNFPTLTLNVESNQSQIALIPYAGNAADVEEVVFKNFNVTGSIKGRANLSGLVCSIIQIEADNAVTKLTSDYIFENINMDLNINQCEAAVQGTGTGTNTLGYAAGFVAFANYSGVKKDVPKIVFNNVSYTGDMTFIANAVSYSAGLIAYFSEASVSDGTSVEIDVSNYTYNGSFNNDVCTNTALYHGGVIGYISKNGNNYSNQTINGYAYGIYYGRTKIILDNIVVSGLNINVPKMNGNVYTPSVIGSYWTQVDAKITNVDISNVTINAANTNTGVAFYTMSGYLDFDTFSMKNVTVNKTNGTNASYINSMFYGVMQSGICNLTNFSIDESCKMQGNMHYAYTYEICGNNNSIHNNLYSYGGIINLNGYDDDGEKYSAYNGYEIKGTYVNASGTDINTTALQRMHYNMFENTEEGFIKGTGTADDPIIIDTPEKLMMLYAINYSSMTSRDYFLKYFGDIKSVLTGSEKNEAERKAAQITAIMNAYVVFANDLNMSPEDFGYSYFAITARGGRYYGFNAYRYLEDKGITEPTAKQISSICATAIAGIDASKETTEYNNYKPVIYMNADKINTLNDVKTGRYTYLDKSKNAYAYSTKNLYSGLFCNIASSEVGIYNLTITGNYYNCNFSINSRGGALVTDSLYFVNGDLDAITNDSDVEIKYIDIGDLKVESNNNTTASGNYGVGLLIDTITASSVDFDYITILDGSNVKADALIGLQQNGTTVNSKTIFRHMDLNAALANENVSSEVEGSYSKDGTYGLKYGIYHYFLKSGNSIYWYETEAEANPDVMTPGLVNTDTGLRTTPNKSLIENKKYAYKIIPVDVNPIISNITKGDGTKASPFVIENEGQLITLALCLKTKGDSTKASDWYVGNAADYSGYDEEDSDTWESDESNNVMKRSDAVEYMSTAYYELADDINFNEVFSQIIPNESLADSVNNFCGIGTSTNPFSGNINGNNHTVTLSNYGGNQTYLYGLFQYVSGIYVKDLTIKAAGKSEDNNYIYVHDTDGSSTTYIGMVAARCLGADNVIDNVTIDADIRIQSSNTNPNFSANVGGYIGAINYGSVTLVNMTEENLKNFCVKYMYTNSGTGVVTTGLVRSYITNYGVKFNRNINGIAGSVVGTYIVYADDTIENNPNQLDSSIQLIEAIDSISYNAASVSEPITVSNMHYENDYGLRAFFNVDVINENYLQTAGRMKITKNTETSGYFVDIENEKQLYILGLAFKSGSMTASTVNTSSVNPYYMKAKTWKTEKSWIGEKLNDAANDYDAWYPAIFQYFDASGVEGGYNALMVNGYSVLNNVSANVNSLSTRTTYRLKENATYDMSVIDKFTGIGDNIYYGAYLGLNNTYTIFNANFDGQGSTIILDIDNSTETTTGFGGLFPQLGSAAQSSNSSVANAYVISNLDISGTVSSSTTSGGLCGFKSTGVFQINNVNLKDLTVNASGNNLNAQANSLAGGLIGYIAINTNHYTYINYNKGDESAYENVAVNSINASGGGVGYARCVNANNITVNNCKVYSKNGIAGGLIGVKYHGAVTYLDKISVTNCNISTDGENAGVGGISGLMYRNEGACALHDAYVDNNTLTASASTYIGKIYGRTNDTTNEIGILKFNDLYTNDLPTVGDYLGSADKLVSIYYNDFHELAYAENLYGFKRYAENESESDLRYADLIDRDVFATDTGETDSEGNSIKNPINLIPDSDKTDNYELVKWSSDAGTMEQVLNSVLNTLTNGTGMLNGGYNNNITIEVVPMEVNNGMASKSSNTAAINITKVNGTFVVTNNNIYDSYEKTDINGVHTPGTYSLIKVKYGIGNSHFNETITIPFFVSNMVNVDIYSRTVIGEEYSAEVMRNITDTSVKTASKDSSYTIYTEYVYSSNRSDFTEPVYMNKVFRMDNKAKPVIPVGAKLTLVDITDDVPHTYYFEVTSQIVEIPLTSFVDENGNNYKERDISKFSELANNNMITTMYTNGKHFIKYNRGVERYFMFVDCSNVTSDSGITSLQSTIIPSIVDYNEINNKEIFYIKEKCRTTLSTYNPRFIGFTDSKAEISDKIVNKSTNLKITAQIYNKASNEYWANAQSNDYNNNNKYLEVAVSLENEAGDKILLPTGTRVKSGDGVLGPVKNTSNIYYFKDGANTSGYALDSITSDTFYDINLTRIIHDNSSSSGLRRIVTVFLILFAFT